MQERDEFRLLRLKKRIRIREIATAIQCSIGHIANFENGRYGMSAKKIELYKRFINENGVG